MAALARGIDDGDGFQTLAGRYRLTTLRVVLRFAADEGYVQASPVDSLSRRQVPEPDEREVRVLDGKELARLLEHTPERSRLMQTSRVPS